MRADAQNWRVVFSHHASKQREKRKIREVDVIRDLRQAGVCPNQTCIVAVLNPAKCRAVIIHAMRYEKTLKIITVIDKSDPVLHQVNEIYEVG